MALQNRHTRIQVLSLVSVAVVVLTAKVLVAWPHLSIFWTGCSALERVMLWRGCLYQDVTLVLGLAVLVAICGRARQKVGLLGSVLDAGALACCLLVTLYSLAAFVYWQFFYTYPNRSALALSSQAGPLLDAAAEMLAQPAVVLLLVLAVWLHGLAIFTAARWSGRMSPSMLRPLTAVFALGVAFAATGWSSPELPLPSCLLVNPLISLVDSRSGAIQLDRIDVDQGPELTLTLGTPQTPGPRGTETRHEPRRFDEKPDVVVVLWESVPSWAVQPWSTTSPWGSLLASGGFPGGKTTPRLAELADRTVLFDNVYANTVQSFSSQSAMIAGQHPPLTSFNWGAQGAEHDLPRLFAQGGYRTACVSASHLTFAGRLQHLERSGFDVVDRPTGASEYTDNSWGVDDRRAFDRVRTFLDAEPDRPALVMAVTVSTHYPYDQSLPGVPDHPNPLNRYLSAIHYDDAQIAGLAKWLATRKRPSLLLVVGDHGEAFDQHPHNVGHGSTLLEENIHVACMLIAPGRAGLPARIGTVGSIVDVAPTLLDLVGLPSEPAHEGKSLLTSRTDDVAISVLPLFDPQLSLRHDRYKFILRPSSGVAQLYDLEADPTEATDLAVQQPERRRAYTRMLSRWARAQQLKSAPAL